MLRVIDSESVSWKDILDRRKYGADFRNASKRTKFDLGVVMDIALLIAADDHSWVPKVSAIQGYEGRFKKKGLPIPTDGESKYYFRTKMITNLKNLGLLKVFKTPGITRDTAPGVEAILITAREIYPLAQALSCVECSLRDNCDLWDNLKLSVKGSSSQGLSPEDMNKLRHKECPFIGQDPEQLLNEATQLLSSMKSAGIEPPSVSTRDLPPSPLLMEGAGDEREHKERSSSSRIAGEWKEQITNFAAQLYSNPQLMFLFSSKVAGSVVDELYREGKLKETRKSTENPVDRRMKSLSEMTRMERRALLDEADSFWGKLAKKDQSVRQSADSDKKGDMYILLDTSQSMRMYSMPSDSWLFSTFGTCASGIVDAFLHRAQKTGETVRLRTFDNAPGSLIVASTDEERARLLKRVRMLSYDGLGTDVMRALEAVVSDFESAKVDPKKTELLMISDLQSGFRPSAEDILKRMRKAGIRVRVVHFPIPKSAGSWGTMPKLIEQLKSHSDLYVSLNDRAGLRKSLLKIVKKI